MYRPASMLAMFYGTRVLGLCVGLAVIILALQAGREGYVRAYNHPMIEYIVRIELPVFMHSRI
jgi:hypothetical protein